MSAECDECAPGDLTHATPAYRRALWLVVILNLGMGIAEIIGGVFSRSQALKADALDFIGDGAITLLSVVALHWSLLWRARSAFVQGVFLAALGIGVFAGTAYRILAQQVPEPETMGWFGTVAFVVNITCALVLVPHRTGDASVRAVWLFSRNDAIGNISVLVAAGLVAWTQTAWPDLAVAIIISGLFLHSAWTILKDARADLQRASAR